MSSTRALETDDGWQTLRALARGGASGELIVASDAIEIHVYLLDGRLAWATSSTAHNEFLRRLVEDHGIAEETLRDVIEECRRVRGKLGETLIEWGVATEEQVRDALKCQIAGALAALSANPGTRDLFLPRRLDYAPSLTFSLEELTPTPATIATAVVDAAQAMVTTVIDGVPDALWVEVVEGTELVARVVRESVRPTKEVRDLQRLLTTHAIDALTVRSSAHGAIMGQRVPALVGALWCAVGNGGKLGVISAVLASAVGAQLPTPEAEAGDAWHEIAGSGVAIPPTVFASAIRTTDELLAAFALGEGMPVGVVRGDIEPHMKWAQRLAPTLDLPIHESFRRTMGSLLYDHVAVRAVIGNVAYYGTRVPSGSLAVWIALRPWASQGLGWALLQTVARQIGADA